MATKATDGGGTVLAVGATPTTIGEVQSVKQSGAKWDTEEATNMGSSSKEFVATVLDWGTFDVEAKRVSTDAGQLLVVAAFNTGAVTSFTLTLPKEGTEATTGDKYVFNAIVTELNVSAEYNKLVPFSAKLKVVGLPVYTQGS